MARTHKVLLAAFDEPEEANAAFEALIDDSMVKKEDVTVITQKPEEVDAVDVDDDSDDSSVAGKMVKGAAWGALAGFVVSAATLILPGIGTIIALGPVANVLGLTGVAATTVTGATAGTIAGGLVAAFEKIGLSREEAEEYEHVVKRGGVFMAVPVRNNENEVRQIFEDNDADHIRVMDISSDDELFV